MIPREERRADTAALAAAEAALTDEERDLRTIHAAMGPNPSQCLATMRDKRAEIESAPACTDLSLGATYPDGSRIPFVAGSIVRFHGAGVYVKTAEMPDAPVYINAWRHVDRERPFVIAGPIGAVPGMLERYRSANALTRDLRGAMVGWSEALADRIATLAPGQALTVPTLVGHATIAREV